MTPIVVPNLTRHLPLKLLALFLGLVVYAHVYTDQEQVAALRVPLLVTGLPANLVLRDTPPAFVELSARGTGKQILKLRLQEPQVLVDLQSVHPGPVQRMLSPSDVILPQGTKLNVIEILEPKMVVLAVDTLLEREVEVMVTQVGTTPEGYLLTGPVTPAPRRVRLRGPASLIQDIHTVVTAPLDLRTGSDSVQLAITLPLEHPGVTVEPAVVEVTLPRVELVERALTPVRVMVEGAARGRVGRVEPDAAVLVLTGPALEIFQLAPRDLEIRLDVRGLAPGRHLLAPRVTLPTPEKIRLLSVQPARFVVEILAPGP
jgi:hypothetical protein